MIRILFVDDHAMFRQGLRGLLQESGLFDIVSECSDSMTALDEIKRVRPDIALVDISMPDVGGIPLVQNLRKEGIAIPVIMLTMHEDPVWCRRAMEAGANGYILKGDAFAELITGIETVLGGSTYISPRIPVDAETPLKELSTRELEVLQLICQGRNNRAIAEELCLSIKTIETHRTKLMKKLNLHNTADLVRRSLELGVF